jgi:hypothetical protein
LKIHKTCFGLSGHGKAGLSCLASSGAARRRLKNLVFIGFLSSQMPYGIKFLARSKTCGLMALLLIRYNKHCAAIIIAIKTRLIVCILRSKPKF